MARIQELLTLLASVLLISGAMAAGDAAGEVNSLSVSIIKSSCGSTRYPDLCYSSLASNPEVSKKVRSKKDVIELSLNNTIKVAETNRANVQKLMVSTTNYTKREKIALSDCLETIDQALFQLNTALQDLRLYPTKKSIAAHADDLKTLMSAAMTNQETCIDGFSHGKADHNARKPIFNGQVHVEKLCSNCLALIKNMTDTDRQNEIKASGNRKLKEVEGGGEWPEWLSAGDRRLLQSTAATPNVVVAADGSGNYRTVSEAVKNAPSKSSKRYVIRIKAGTYKENVEVPKSKTNIMFIGDGRGKTVITGNRNVIDGSTTFNSATVAVVGERFLARDITFQNTAGPSKEQAVALRVGSDLSAFYNCEMKAYQDTLYVHSNRQFYVKCLISGTVDFIFGNAAAVFQDCDIQPRRPNSGQKNMLTAQGRTDPNQNTGIVIQKCRIAASSDLKAVQKSFPTYLGRPWKEYSRTVVMQSSISDVVHLAGWHEWSGSFAVNTLFYGEHSNTGAGAATSQRVKWKGFKVISSATEAQSYTAGRFISGSNWLGSTGFPFSLGL
nr:pectinesterase/pectinesterase inhibitor U1 [Ipomoea batatas]